MATTEKTVLHEIICKDPFFPERTLLGKTTVTREDGAKRSRVVAHYIYEGKRFALGYFRFNYSPERFEHPLLSWLNVWFRYQYPSNEYARKAVLNGTKLLHLTTTTEYGENYDNLPDGVTLKPVAYSDGFHQAVFYLYREGRLSDHFAKDQVLAFFEKLGVTLPDDTIRTLSQLWDVSFSDYLGQVPLAQYSKQEGENAASIAVHEVMMGLLQGWPLEAIASRLEKVILTPVKEKKTRPIPEPTRILCRTQVTIPSSYAKHLYGEDSDVHMESFVALREGDKRCTASFYSGYKGAPLEKMELHGVHRFRRTESEFKSPYVRWGFAPFGDEDVTVEPDSIASVFKVQRLAMRLETDYAGICMDDDYRHFPSHEYDGISQYDLENNVLLLIHTAKKTHWEEWAQSLLPGNLRLVASNCIMMHKDEQERDYNTVVYYVCKPGYIKDYFNLEEVLAYMDALGVPVTEGCRTLMAHVWNMRIEQILDFNHFTDQGECFADICFAYEVTYGLLQGWPLEVAAARIKEGCFKKTLKHCCFVPPGC